MIQLQGVSYTYPGSASAALREIDLTVPDGEWLLLAGPSGGGKSTLLVSPERSCPACPGRRHPRRRSSRWPRACKRSGPGVEPAGGDGLPESRVTVVHAAGGEDVAFGCENLGFPPLETQEPRGASPRAAFAVCLAEPRGVQSLGRPETAVGDRRGLGDGLSNAPVGRADQRPRRGKPRGVALCPA